MWKEVSRWQNTISKERTAVPLYEGAEPMVLQPPLQVIDDKETTAKA